MRVKYLPSDIKSVLFLFIILNCYGANSALDKYKILGVFSHPGKSHFDVFKPLLEELAKRGHELTVVSYFPRDNKSISLPNYHDIDLAKSLDVFVNVVDLMRIKHSALSVYLEVAMLREWAMKCCEAGLNVPEVRELIKSDAKFDLIITEAFNSRCFLGFVHRFNAPFISLSSHVLMPWANNLGNPENPTYVPNLFHGFSSNMNFLQRLINTLDRLLLKFVFDVAFDWPMHTIVEEAFGPGVPPLGEIAKKESAILVNSHYSLQGAKPNVPNVVEIGGLHIRPSKPLPNDLKKILDDAKEGVLFFSWGSMIKTSSMSNQKLDEILKAIGNIPRKVIWKWEDEDLKNKPKNVIIRKWLPQDAILNHPNVKCYLAHGGLLGLSESVSAGVPMVVVPMYGDQFNNAAAARERGVAVVLEWNTLDANTLRSAIDLVFNDTSYQTNAKLLQKAYNDRPATALQTAVWWTEYIARGNGKPFIKSAATSLAWYQILAIDVIFVVAIFICITIYISYRLLCWIKSLQRKSKTKTNNKSMNKKTE
nr:UDP-glucosyltransferase 403G1 [Meteorus pulchricornis]